MTLDDIRAKYPHLGAAAYAYTPGGPVTVEFLTTEGTSFKYVGPTEAAAIAGSPFGEDDEPPAPAPVVVPTPPTPSIFD